MRLCQFVSIPSSLRACPDKCIGGNCSQCSDDAIASSPPKSPAKAIPDMSFCARGGEATRELFPGPLISQSAPSSPSQLTRPVQHAAEADARGDTVMTACRRSHSDSELSALSRRFALSRMPQRQVWSQNTDSSIVCLTLSDFGFSNSSSASGSSFACTEPFQMLTKEACHLLRSEIFAAHSPEFLDDKMEKAAYFAHQSPFIRELETSQKFENLINRLVDVPVVSCGTAHALIRGPGASSAVDWHRDTSTFCCVVMLSQVPTNAEGGETYVRKSGDDEVCLRFPEGGIGCAYLMQGSHFEHRLEPAVNFECLTLTIWLRPADGWGGDGVDFDAFGFVPWD